MREKKKYGLQKPSANVNRSGCEHYHMQNKKQKKKGGEKHFGAATMCNKQQLQFLSILQMKRIHTLIANTSNKYTLSSNCAHLQHQ